MAKEKVGFIGLGIMGSAMASNLLKAGYPLTVYNRTPAKAKTLAASGAQTAASARDCAAQSDILMLNLPDGPTTKELLFGKEAAADGLRPGSTVIIFSTIAPKEAIEIAEKLAAKKMRCLDAPVSGGDIGARDATLTIMVGGEELVFREMEPILSRLGKKIVYIGGSGAGEMMKAVNQVAVALSVAAMTESLALARACGIEMDQALDVLQSGAAGSWTLSNYAPRVLRGDLKPGFFAKHMLKDLNIALEKSNSSGLALPAANLVRQLYQALCDGPRGAELGNHALIALYEQRC